MAKLKTLLLVLAVQLFSLVTINTAFAANNTDVYPSTYFDEYYRQLYLSHPYLEGDDILELETGLKAVGIYPGKVDNIFDEKTKVAIMKLQEIYGLDANGVVNQETWQALTKTFPEPSVPPSSPAPEGELKIEIDLHKHLLTLYSDGKPYKTYPVAIGKSETPSPVGEFKVVHKAINWGTGFGTRWLGLNIPWGTYGIHGTNKPWSIGRAESHGCFRMFNKQVEELYPWIKHGTPVKVIGDISTNYNRKLKVKMSGQDVVLLQQKLKEIKLLWTPADGRFGAGTENAVKYYQLLNGLKATGEADKNTWKLLMEEKSL